MNDLDFYTNISQHSNNILIRGIKNGKPFRDKFQPDATAYIEHKDDFGWKSIHGKNLKPLHFDTIREMKDFAEGHKESNLKVYGMPNFCHMHALQNYSDSIDKFDKSKIRVFNIDIEVTSTEGFPEAEEAKYPVTAICVHDSVLDKFIVFGDNKWEHSKSELPQELLDKTKYIQCSDEQQLLSKFIQYWTTFTPDIVTGWNIEMFDIPYLVNRITRVGLDANKLSPWGIVRERMIQTRHGREQTYKIVGVDDLDYIAMYRKNKIQESYRLDFIASVELGERKLDYSEVQGLHNLYFENYQKFIDYNIQDVNLVKRLDEKLGLIDATILVGYEACVNFSDVSSPVRTWDCLINKEMYQNRQVPHYSTSNIGNNSPIPGGFVKEPQVGKHGWCMSFDLNSLYPHLIMQFNISPETLIENWQLWSTDSPEKRVKRLLNKEDLGQVPEGCSISAAGFAFRNDKQGIIPKLMSKMYNDRKRYKKRMLSASSELQKIKGSGSEKEKELAQEVALYDLRQYVMKILLNSGYGAFINKYFRWFDTRLGEAITLSGQMVIQVAEREINKWMNKVCGTDGIDYIIAIDTDSNYVNVQPLVDKHFPNKTKAELIDILDKVAQEQIQKVLDDGFDDTREYLNAFEQKMVMEREAIASSAFWTSKKRYAMCVWDMEGVRMSLESPKIKIQGLEAIRSSTPQCCRGALLQMINLTLLEDEETVQRYIAEFKEEFNSMPFEEISFPRSMNNIGKFTKLEDKKGCPPQVRGAIKFNELLRKHGLENVWESMKDGEKGKFIYLREPNSLGSNVISFTNSCPEVFEVNKYVDREKMFEKAILDPMENILKPIGWSSEKIASLEDFFG